MSSCSRSSSIFLSSSISRIFASFCAYNVFSWLVSLAPLFLAPSVSSFTFSRSPWSFFFPASATCKSDSSLATSLERSFNFFLCFSMSSSYFSIYSLAMLSWESLDAIYAFHFSFKSSLSSCSFNFWFKTIRAFLSLSFYIFNPGISVGVSSSSGKPFIEALSAVLPAPPPPKFSPYTDLKALEARKPIFPPAMDFLIPPGRKPVAVLIRAYIADDVWAGGPPLALPEAAGPSEPAWPAVPGSRLLGSPMRWRVSPPSSPSSSWITDVLVPFFLVELIKSCCNMYSKVD